MDLSLLRIYRGRMGGRPSQGRLRPAQKSAPQGEFRGLSRAPARVCLNSRAESRPACGTAIASTVLGRTAAYTVIEQEALARFMMFSKRIHLVLEVREHAGTIRFRDRCGQSFSRYEDA